MKVPGLEERSAIRKPTGLQVALADRIGQLDPEAWRTVSRDQSFFFSLPYLRMLQAVAPENVEPRYALVSRGRRAARGPVRADHPREPGASRQRR